VVVEEGVLQGGAMRVYGVGAVGEVVPAGDVVGEVVDAHCCVRVPRKVGREGGLWVRVGGLVMAWTVM